MITRMDEGIGQIVDLVEELGLTERTIIIFASDNGPTGIGGVELDFFESAGGLKRAKSFLYEGGIRVPMIASWPGTIEPNTTTSHISAMWDVLATLADLVGTPIPPDTDGISFLPTLLGQDSEQEEHDFLYWEKGTVEPRLFARVTGRRFERTSAPSPSRRSSSTIWRTMWARPPISLRFTRTSPSRCWS